jgi:hypothetical protein
LWPANPADDKNRSSAPPGPTQSSRRAAFGSTVIALRTGPTGSAQAGQDHHQRHGAETQRVGGLETRRQEHRKRLGHEQRNRQSGGRTPNGQPGGLAQHHPQDVAACGAQSDPNADFPRAARLDTVVYKL